MATSQELLDQIQVQNIRYMQNLVTRAQTDPRSLSEEELAKAYQFGQQLGVDMKNTTAKDKATWYENAGAFGVGALDSLLFGLIPNDLYSSYRTKQARNMGQLAGDALSFAIPAFGVGAGAKMLFKGAKGLKGLVGAKKALTVADLTSDAIKAVDTAKDVVSGSIKSQKIALNMLKEAKAGKSLAEKNASLLINEAKKLTGKGSKKALSVAKQQADEILQTANSKIVQANDQLSSAKKGFETAKLEYKTLKEDLPNIINSAESVVKKSNTPFMQTPLKDLGGQLGQTTSSITEVAKTMGKQSWERASMLTPQEILNMAKAIVQGTRTMNNAYGSVMPSRDLSQTNPYLIPADMNGMPPL